jgi:hypothetical protein
MIKRPSLTERQSVFSLKRMKPSESQLKRRRQLESPRNWRQQLLLLLRRKQLMRKRDSRKSLSKRRIGLERSRRLKRLE